MKNLFAGKENQIYNCRCQKKFSYQIFFTVNGSSYLPFFFLGGGGRYLSLVVKLIQLSIYVFACLI